MTSLSLTLDRVLDHHFHRETASPLPEGEGSAAALPLLAVEGWTSALPFGKSNELESECCKSLVPRSWIWHFVKIVLF